MMAVIGESKWHDGGGVMKSDIDGGGVIGNGDDSGRAQWLLSHNEHSTVHAVGSFITSVFRARRSDDDRRRRPS